MSKHLAASVALTCLAFTPCAPNAKGASRTHSVSAGGSPSAGEKAPIYGYKIVRTLAHDPNAFTQGIVFHDGFLFESTGINGASSLRKVELETGKIVKKISVPDEYFAEGMTIFNDKIYQLTWKNQKGFIYSIETLRKIGEFRYEGEGWGLTHDAESLILSDGTSKIRFLHPETFKVSRTIDVSDADGSPVVEINELEYVKGEIYANIWHSDKIARIDPQSGKVTGWIDLTNLFPNRSDAETEDVLNGIAYDAHGDRLFVTGKLWSKLFEVQVTPHSPQP
jgi:glutamine cyclotransferase